MQRAVVSPQIESPLSQIYSSTESQSVCHLCLPAGRRWKIYNNKCILEASRREIISFLSTNTLSFLIMVSQYTQQEKKVSETILKSNSG